MNHQTTHARPSTAHASRKVGRPSTLLLLDLDRALRQVAASARLDAMPSPKALRALREA